MSRKTKAEKIAKSIKHIRSISNADASIQKSSDTSYESMSKIDALKTLLTSLFVLSIITLTFVLQMKGYIG